MCSPTSRTNCLRGAGATSRCARPPEYLPRVLLSTQVGVLLSTWALGLPNAQAAYDRVSAFATEEERRTAFEAIEREGSADAQAASVSQTLDQWLAGGGGTDAAAVRSRVGRP